MAKILAIDLGTTYFKTALFDGAGQLCDVCRIAPPVAVPVAGRMEVSADGFAETVAEGIETLRKRDPAGLADVEAVVFSTQTNSFVLLDAGNRPLTPIVLWPDERALELEPEVCSRCNLAGFAATTGIPHVNRQFTPAKLLWFQRQRPDVWQQTRRICLISDYLTLLLTGKHVTEAGAAGLTGMVDIHRCGWWPAMLDRFEVALERLPTVVRAGTDLGAITADAAERFGLPATCRFIVGCLDQYAGAVGAGNVAPGMVSETTGTVLATVRCADRFAGQLNEAVFQGPAFQSGLYWEMVFGEISANYLQWYRDQLPDRPEFDALTVAAATVEPGAAGLRLKAGVGLTKPEEVFNGWTPERTQAEAVRCIMEAVAAALDDQVTALAGGVRPREIRCAGGAARSDLWLQIKADLLGVATAATLCPEPTSLGAAVLAEASLSGRSVQETAGQWVRFNQPHRPSAEIHRKYEAIRASFPKSL